MANKSEGYAQSDKYRSLVAQVSKNTQNMTQVRFQPTLFIFLGTSSGQIAYRVKKLLYQAYGDVPILRTLWVDLDRDIDPKAKPWISSSERAELVGFDPAAVIKNLGHYPSITQWWPSAQVPPGLLGSGAPQQMRLIGRLALFRMFNDRTQGEAFIDHLHAAVEALFEVENIRATEAKSTDKVIYSVEKTCRVILVFSTSGGSGSSLSFDVAYLCRHLLAGKNPTIISMSVLPPVIDKAILSETQVQKEKIRANTYAWFKEQNHLTENPSWRMEYPEGALVDVSAPPFDYRYILDIENQAGYRLNSPDDIYNMIAHAIFLDTGSSIAGAMRGFTANQAALGEQFEGMSCSFSSFAAASLIYPKERLMDYCATKLGHQLITNGLMGSVDEHQVRVDSSAVLSELRLSDADLLSDLLSKSVVKMQYEATINKADSVATAITQIDAQENQNQVARQAEVTKINKASVDLLIDIKKRLDKEMSRLASTRGFSFANAIFDSLLETAPVGSIDSEAISLDSLRMRITQQGVTEGDLETAKNDYKRAYEALKKLDDGPEDAIERIFFPASWKKKFALYKRNCINAMAKINDLVLQLAAQQYARNLYDQLSAHVSALKTNLAGAVTNALRVSSEMQDASEKLSSVVASQAQGYEFMQEIDVDFGEFFEENSADIDPKTSFQGMIPARSSSDISSLVSWTMYEIKAAAHDYAQKFFVEKIENTSLLSTLQKMAEKLGLEPQSLIENQLNKLVEYCHPFWNYDKDRGLSGVEGKSILGLEDESSPLIPLSYRTSTRFQLKTTGFRDRIDLVRIQHGLPAFLIRGMDEYRTVYELKRKGTDPLHVLPGMEFARDIRPEQGRQGRDLFAVALVFGYIVQNGQWFYYDRERAYLSHKIQPANEFRLAQGREKAEENFAHHSDWVTQVEQAIDDEVRRMGNDAAIEKLEKSIENLKKAISKMASKDELRKQYDKEIAALANMQRRLGKIG